MHNQSLTYTTRQSVAVQCDEASQLGEKLPITMITALRECMLELFLVKKHSHNSVQNGCIEKYFKLALKATYKKVFLKYQPNTMFPSLYL